jgi:small subunit ribosomal protein S20
MPITKQVIKRVKQAETGRARNRHYGNRMKSLMKLLLGYVRKGEAEQVRKTMPEAMKAIDMAAKKNIIHKNNAARKKSRIQKAINTMGSAPKKEEKVVKKTAKKSEKAEESSKKEEA